MYLKLVLYDEPDGETTELVDVLVTSRFCIGSFCRDGAEFPSSLEGTRDDDPLR